MPREWVLGASVMSLVSLGAGTVIWGSDFAANVVASLVLIGPGLFLTNVVARNWQSKRTDKFVMEQAEVDVLSAVLVLRENVLHNFETLQQLLPDKNVPTPVVGRPDSPRAAVAMLERDWSALIIFFYGVERDDDRLVRARWRPLWPIMPSSLMWRVRSLSHQLPTALMEHCVAGLEGVESRLESVVPRVGPPLDDTDTVDVSCYISLLGENIELVRSFLGEMKDALPDIPYVLDPEIPDEEWPVGQLKFIRESIVKAFSKTDARGL